MIKKKIAKLIDVKSIITIFLVCVFCIMTLSNRVISSDFMNVFTIVIAFYFGTQSAKKSTDLESEEK